MGVVRLGAQTAPALEAPAPTRQASLTAGSILGTVSDPGGRGLSGALVSALGTTSAVATTDSSGAFALRGLPAGTYVLRAHLAGFVASDRELVDVRPNGRQVAAIRLHPVSGAAFALPTALTAGFGTGVPLPTPGDPDDPAATDDAHPHTPMAWRLRHVKRSVLRDANGLPVEFGDDDEVVGPVGNPADTWFAWAIESSARLASTLFTEFPFSGEFNLLTTGTLNGPEAVSSNSRLPDGVAFLSLGAPVGDGDWSMNAALSGGDVSSWILSGAYATRGPRTHAYNMGLSYGTQSYKGANAAALAAMAGGNRSVGAVFGYDHWTISRAVDLSYGARWARYDYVDRPNMFSPRVGLSVSPVERTYVRAVVSQRMLAPGAEEFLPPSRGTWLPPERTFSAIGDDGFRVERVRSFEVALEREFDDASVVGVRRFYQDTDDQLVAVFGVSQLTAIEADPAHYFVGSAGAVSADGWGVRFSSPVTRRLRGSIDYSLTHAHWAAAAAAAGSLPGVVSRSEAEDLHDVTTSLEAAIPETSTRVYVVYKINSGYARPDGDTTSGLDGRFDLTVNQGLPFRFISAQWEVLVGVRNLFREPEALGSVYDELLVVRPPTRVVGGFLVRF